MDLPWLDVPPRIDPSAFVEASARIVGDVVLGPECSVWYFALIRGDVGSIRIGRRTNVQDHVVIHCTRNKASTTIGDEVSIGHRAVLHGCTVGDRVLVGMGAILMDGVEIGDDCIVGAGALVTPGTCIPAGSLVVGSPGRVKRPLEEGERAFLKASAANYVGYSHAYREAWSRSAPGLMLLPRPPVGRDLP